ncbi:Protein kinase [Phytophthora megakarya]|uniref:Protein kinase n=1 Tax=Phytophthora megakarya TaxID=4795 RepID=A0A225X3D3_9STRA|nr:Protein kinase [Phytophthora megakarya]
MLPRSKGKDEGVAAADTICELCDLYTHNDLDGKWTELAEVYDQRRNVDNFREILDLSAPNARMGDLNGWHLERMAVDEFGPAAGASANDLAEIKRESRVIKETLMKVMANGRDFKAKRDELEAAMTKQREALTVELKEAKEFLGQAHLLNACDSAAIEVSEPAPVEERLRATVKHPELSPTVDLSAAPSI